MEILAPYKHYYESYVSCSIVYKRQIIKKKQIPITKHQDKGQHKQSSCRRSSNFNIICTLLYLS